MRSVHRRRRPSRGRRPSRRTGERWPGIRRVPGSPPPRPRRPARRGPRMAVGDRRRHADTPTRRHAAPPPAGTARHCRPPPAAPAQHASRRRADRRGGTHSRRGPADDQRAVLTTALRSGTVLGNRIAKAAMEENMAGDGQVPAPRLLALYRNWAAGGAGLLITGNVMVHAEALTGPAGAVLDDAAQWSRSPSGPLRPSPAAAPYGCGSTTPAARSRQTCPVW